MAKVIMLPERSAQRPVARLLADYYVDDENQLHHPILRRFDALWRDAAGDDRLPGRQDLPHDDMVDLLPHLMLLEVSGQDDRVRFRSRLVGEHHVEMNGRNSAGEFIDEGRSVACIDHGALMDVLATRTPLYTRHRVELPNGRMIDCEGAIYPLAGDGANVDRVAALVVPHYPREYRSSRLFGWA